MKSKNIKPDIVAMLIILAISALYCWVNIPRFGLDDHDETFYLNQAILGWFISSWGPIFVKLIKYLIIPFASTYLEAHDALLFLVSGVVFPTAIYFFLRSAFLTPFGAVPLTLLALFSKANLASHPHIHIFNLSFLLLSFSIFFVPKSFLRLLFFFFIIGCSLYLRQENQIFLITTWIGLIAHAVYTKKKRVVILSIGTLSASAAGFLILFSFWGTPFENRGFLAFRDHFSWNSANSLSSITEFDSKFSSAKSMSEFIATYPKPFVTHTFENLRNLPKNVVDAMLTKRFGTPRSLVRVFFPCLLLALVFLLLWSSKELSFKKSGGNSLWVIACLGIILQGLSLTIVLTPWVKYLSGIAITVFCVIVPYGLSKLRWKPSLLGKGFQALLVVGILAGSVAAIFLEDVHFTSKNESRKVAEVFESRKMFFENAHIASISRLPYYGLSLKKNKMSTIAIFDLGNKWDISKLRVFLISNRIDVFCYEPLTLMYSAQAFSIEKQLAEFIDKLESSNWVKKYTFGTAALSYSCLKLTAGWNEDLSQN